MTIGGERQASWPRLCWGQLSWACAWSHDTGVVGEGVGGTMGENKGREPGEKGKGIVSYKERYRSTVVEAERHHRVK